MVRPERSVAVTERDPALPNVGDFQLHPSNQVDISNLEPRLPSSDSCGMRILGFKPSRFRQWEHLIRLEGRHLGVLPRFIFFLKIALAAFQLGGVTRATWRFRIRHCWKCPIYNRELKSCRPYPGSKLGCGCFAPLLAMTWKPYPKGCWIKQFIPSEPDGWE